MHDTGNHNMVKSRENVREIHGAEELSFCWCTCCLALSQLFLFFNVVYYIA